MKEYVCPKCGSIDVFIDKRGVQQALCCGDCGAWIKWISKKELPLVKRYLEQNIENDIEFTGETLCIATNNEFKDKFQIRIWQYNGSKVKYYEVDKKVIPKILEILESDVIK